jgi:sulfur-carrier protein adenylyltransferase/sulfurtransferase
MALLDYFQKIATRSAQEIRSYMASHGPDTYMLIDVRQPEEYQAGHLPGAQLIPLDAVPDRSSELDRTKPVFVYCAAGVRSRAAAAVLKRAGIPEVYSMAGGINAWNGQKAQGPPDAGMIWFAAAHSPEQVIALAWLLEDGTRQFYREMMARQGKGEASQLFQKLATAESHHEKALLQLYRQRTGQEADDTFPQNVLGEAPGPAVMEGGMALAAALDWAADRPVREIIELAMSLEVNSYDRYLALRQQFNDESSREVFGLLAAEEHAHLNQLTELFDKELH